MWVGALLVGAGTWPEITAFGWETVFVRLRETPDAGCSSTGAPSWARSREHCAGRCSSSLERTSEAVGCASRTNRLRQRLHKTEPTEHRLGRTLEYASATVFSRMTRENSLAKPDSVLDENTKHAYYLATDERRKICGQLKRPPPRAPPPKPSGTSIARLEPGPNGITAWNLVGSRDRSRLEATAKC